MALGAALGACGGDGVSQDGCGSPNPEAERKLMQAYLHSPAMEVRQVDARSGLPQQVLVQIPPIHFDGPGRSRTLAVGPCQHIYRSDHPIRRAGAAPPSPFRYAEVDWNTEGKPRGPNGSFASAHFDFHFYLQPRAWVDRFTNCVSTNGRTCDSSRTAPDQMRRFLRLPPARYFPSDYRPDLGSSIPRMGLHLLDQRYPYTRPYVDHHPVLLYGTFDGQVLFAEASVTLATLQDAVSAPSHTLAFSFKAPRAVRNGLPWPTRFIIRHLPSSGGFTVAFAGFRRFPA